MKSIDGAGAFAVSEGDVYQLVFPHELDRYVFRFDHGGRLASTIKLSPRHPIVPSQVGVFPTGQMLVAGLEYTSEGNGAMWPFTGIFSADGSMLRQVYLDEDETLHDMAAKGDLRVTQPGQPLINRAVSSGSVEIGPDSNAYLMRRTDPAVVYVISAGGQVIRKFSVDPGIDGFLPTAMHISGGGIAVLFSNEQTWTYRMKIVDPEGRELATYDQDPVTGNTETGRISGAFACYLQNPTRFAFAGAADDLHMQLWIAQPR